MPIGSQSIATDWTFPVVEFFGCGTDWQSVLQPTFLPAAVFRAVGDRPPDVVERRGSLARLRCDHPLGGGQFISRWPAGERLLEDVLDLRGDRHVAGGDALHKLVG